MSQLDLHSRDRIASFPDDPHAHLAPDRRVDTLTQNWRHASHPPNGRLALEEVRIHSADALDVLARSLRDGPSIHGAEALGILAQSLRNTRGVRGQLMDADEDYPMDLDDDQGHGADAHNAPSSSATPRLRKITVEISPDELSPTFPTSALLDVYAISSTTLTHLHLTYTEHLLAHDARISRMSLSLPVLTHLILSDVGPRGCELLRDLNVQLQEVEVDFDDAWVTAIICDSFSPKHHHAAVVPELPNGQPSGLPTPAPTPATTPAVPPGYYGILPDPVPLLAHSMASLKTLRASNAVIVTVADKLRYPAVRTLALRIAGVPTVTPLVHAFPAVADMYVYTPYDGCGIRAPSASPFPSPIPAIPLPFEPAGPGGDEDEDGSEASGVSSPPPSSDVGSPPQSPVPAHAHAHRKRKLRPPMPYIHATRDANRTSQLYSSFPPLSVVRGFAPGLYALGLTCAVRHLEIGALTPPSVGGHEAVAVRKLLADTMPPSVSLGLGRGWWAPGTFGPRGRGRRKGGRERDGLRTIFGGEGGAGGQLLGEGSLRQVADGGQHGRAQGQGQVQGLVRPAAWTGVSELVVRVEEPGRWRDVTRDVLAMLRPLADSLSTFILHWDRTSVPFDRIPLDDDDDDDDGSDGSEDDGDGDPDAMETETERGRPDGDSPASKPARPRRPSVASREEAFAQRVAEQMPLLRYFLLEIVHDVPDAPGARACERRYWRVDRSEEWLCLDQLSEADARVVLDTEGLSFEDRVRY